MWLRIPRPCGVTCPLCMTPLRIGPDAAAREALRERISHAQSSDHNDVTLFLQQELEESLDVAQLAAVAELFRRKPVLIGELHQLRPAPAPELIGRQYVTLHGASEATHQLRALRADSWRETSAVFRAKRELSPALHVELTKANLGEIPALVRLLVEWQIPELLLSDFQPRRSEELPLKPSPAEVVRGIDELWQAADGTRLRLRLLGFGEAGHAVLPPGPPAPAADSNLLEILRQGIRLPSARAGVAALGTAASTDAGFELAALGAPVLQLPPCLGGTLPADGKPRTTGVKSAACRACAIDDRCPGAPRQLQLADPAASLRPLPSWRQWRADRTPVKVLILSPQGEDPALYYSTLPGLTESLRQRGAEVELVSPWVRDWQSGPLTPLRFRSRRPTFSGFTGVDEWLRTHALTGYDLVIAADVETAARILAAGSLSSNATVVVADFHMLRGVDGIRGPQPAGQRAEAGGWWPSERLILASGFPGYVHLYLRQGIPLRQVSWRPVCLHAGNFPRGPDPTTCRVIMSGGNHRRDLDTLAAAARILPRQVHGIHLYSDRPFPSGKHLRYKGTVSLPRFHGAMARSRFVVVPMTEDRHRAAGITVIVEAFMAGRPVIASSIAAARDYIRDGIDGLLVPPADPRALAEAITRLDTEPGLLARLAEGARRAASAFSTEAWADEIVSGRGLRLPVMTGNEWKAWA